MRRSLAAVSFALAFAACGGRVVDSNPAGGRDAGVDAEETFVLDLDGSPHDARHADGAHLPDRMSPHGMSRLSAMRVHSVYIGTNGVDASPEFDVFLSWLVHDNAYWRLLDQYGVGDGALVDTIRFRTDDFFPSGSVKNGLIESEELDARVLDRLSAYVSTAVGFGPDDAFVIFLPSGVNVSFGARGTHVFQTCIESGGYHAHDGREPYAVIPPCAMGRGSLSISHEITELATDPLPNHGWYSDVDETTNGGEIADVCSEHSPSGVDGWLVAPIWSNAAGACKP